MPGQSCRHDSEAPWRSLSETNRASKHLTATELVEKSVARTRSAENQIAEKMERDLGRTGDEKIAQEPEEAEAPAASSGGGQEEKMQEEETAVMWTKRPMEDEETQGTLEDEPKNSINSDSDMGEELNKLKMQNWNFMRMVKGSAFR